MTMKPSLLRQLAHAAIALQIVLATLLLVWGEGSLLLFLLTLVLLGVSAYVTDWRQSFHLNQRGADLLALGAVAISAIAAVRTDRQGLLLVVANLQSYLQYVLMFQPKNSRVYWQLSLLSLGQMAIASTLYPDPAFGIVLLLQVVLGIVAFALLLLDSEFEAARLPSGGLLALHGGVSESRIPDQHSVGFDPSYLWKSLLPLAIAAALGTLILATPLFLALPRWTVSTFESTDTDPIRTVGFTDTVMLGELGGAVNNPELVMRVTFYRGRGDSAMRLVGEPLFRGTVVTRYEDRTWTQPTPSHPIPLPAEAGSTITRQRISVEPLDTAEIFHIAPAVAIDEPDSKLKLNPSTGRLFRLDEYRHRTLEFDIGTTGIRGNRQRTVLPSLQRPLNMQALLQPFDERSGADQFPRITALASEILSEAGIDPKRNPLQAARTLSEYFHTSGEFFYSLEAQQRDPTLDPIEDFVSENRAGHCEYFAGALVLMLRSQGIPARMVIGFKGGEWNDVGKYYQVQQLHAHAWVEALLIGNQVPLSEFAGEEVPREAWLVLDPTEGTQDVTNLNRGGVVASIRQAIDYGRVLWINYFASLNAKRQRQGIYEPLAAGVEAGAENVTSVEVWQERLTSLEQSRLGRFWFWYRRHWFSWRGGLVAIGFSLAATALFLGLRSAWKMVRRRGWLGTKPPAVEVPVLEMYRRLEAVLAPLGLVRGSSQTAYEFALAAGGELADRTEYRRLAPLPGRVVTAFYRLRFGGHTLGTPEAEAVEQALTELERSLDGHRK